MVTWGVWHTRPGGPLLHDTLDARTVARIRKLAARGALRVAREEARLSLRELAAVVATSPASLSRWETGRASPRPAAALRWARALDALEGS